MSYGTWNRHAAEKHPESLSHLAGFELKPLTHYFMASNIELPERPTTDTCVYRLHVQSKEESILYLTPQNFWSTTVTNLHKIRSTDLVPPLPEIRADRAISCNTDFTDPPYRASTLRLYVCVCMGSMALINALFLRARSQDSLLSVSVRRVHVE